MSLYIPDEAPISRSPETEHLAQIPPLGEHRPVWLTVDCPSCGSAPCGPHPDVLVCTECTDDWPCGYAKTTATELDRLAALLDECEEAARTDANSAWTTDGFRRDRSGMGAGHHADAVVLRARSRELRGGTHD